MANSLDEWYIILGVMILIGIAGLWGMAVHGEKSVSNLYLIPAGIFSSSPQQAAVLQAPPHGGMNHAGEPCIPDERREYLVVQGRQFTYGGNSSRSGHPV